MLRVHREIGTHDNGLINVHRPGIAVEPGDIVRFPDASNFNYVGIVVYVSATYAGDRCDIGVIWSGAKRLIATASNDNTDSYKFSHPLVA